MITDLLPAIFSLSASIAISLVLFFGIKWALSETKFSDSVKLIISRLVQGPVVAAILASGLLLAAESSTNLLTNLPSYLKIPELRLIAELIVLAIFIRTVGVIVGKEVPNLIKAREADKILVYSVYSAGLFILAYLVLTSTISPKIQASVWSLLNFLTGLFMTYLAVYVVNVVFKRYTFAIESKEAGLRTTITFLRRLVLSIVALVGVAASTFASFPSLGVEVASLFVAAGFASIVIGLAAQTTLANLIAGMVISTSQPFRVGDALSYANEWAWVEDIKLTFTVLRTWDNRRLVVPNQLFLNSTMVNYDLTDSSKLCVVYVSITYDSDLDRAIEILKDITRKHPDFLPAGNLPVVHVMDLGDANSSFADANASPGILLRVLGRAKDQPTNFQMSKDILYAAKKEFDSNGIQLAYPKRQIVIDQRQANSETLWERQDFSKVKKEDTKSKESD